jgi:hypothetical protein
MVLGESFSPELQQNTRHGRKVTQATGIPRGETGIAGRSRPRGRHNSAAPATEAAPPQGADIDAGGSSVRACCSGCE